MRKRRIRHALSVLIIAGILFSCSESNIGTSSNSDPLAAENIEEVAVQKSHGDSPQKVFSEFKEMRKKVETMSKAEIDSLSDEEVLELGEPILKVTEGTIELSDKTLQELKAPAAEMAERIRSISKDQYNELSDRFLQVIRRYEGDQPTFRNLGTADIKSILLDYADAESGTMQMSATCSSMFNTMGSFVFIYPGDNLNTANSICAAGSTFYVHQGTYYSQKIEDSKDGNEWVGINDPILDGQFSVNKAFTSGMKNSIINGLTIRKYTEYGIHSTSSSTKNVLVTYMTFKKIAPNKNGEGYGAIWFEHSEDIEIKNSYFENVAMSIQFMDATGPLKVLNNEALNSGRNFVQVSESSGSGIRINGNSLDRTAGYGTAPLEDWISIFKSSGTSGDPIQVNNNRARGHSSSGHGSFIMLGDYGGEHQEAVGNIGVNPGQVGIGAHGGDDIYVADNKMFGEVWSESNVAFSSYNATTQYSCSNHDFENNTAKWICGDSQHCSNPPADNKAYASSGSLSCDLTDSEINNATTWDDNMTANVWNEW